MTTAPATIAAAAAEIAALDAAAAEARRRLAVAREIHDALSVQSSAEARAADQAKRTAAAPDAWRALLDLLAAEEKLLNQADALLIGLQAIDAEKARSQGVRQLAGVSAQRVGMIVREPFRHAAAAAARRRGNLARDRAAALEGLAQAVGSIL